MAKRFFDTNVFSDEWVSDLSKDGKLFFLYYIATCDYAGVLKFNKKLCEFQTGLQNTETLIEELGDSLLRAGQESVYFMPRFIKFQYPGFPNSKVVQQDSAVKILKKHGFWDEKNNTYLRVGQESVNSHVNVSDNVNDNASVNDNGILGVTVNKLTREKNAKGPF